MSSTLGFSIIDENKQENKTENKPKKEMSSKGRNRTVKKRATKGKTFLNFIHSKPDTKDINSDDDTFKNIQNLHKFEKEEEDDGVGENITEYKNYSLLNNDSKNINSEEEMIKLGKEQQLKYMEDNIRNGQNSDKYLTSRLTGIAQNKNNIMPYANKLFKADNEDDLMKKLNYVIHLLEEQQDEKTGNITEELILYTFLGIFVIFIVDCFAKTAKYKR